MRSYLDFHPDVAEALETGSPVVALESTVITHGLPYPQNLETARRMEAAVRQGGATPATIAVLKGRIRVGLTADELAGLARRAADSVRKVSRRDLPLVVARGEDGGTTVAGTMRIAHAAGIPVFATGGIGGVHRGHPFDVSADLHELGRTPVCVVCSGAKAILDLPATREVLESHGVPVLGFRSDEMAAFFSRSSGLPVDLNVPSAAAAADVLRAHRRLALQSGVLLSVPIPDDAALEGADLGRAVDQAIAEADARGIHGPAATPWLLGRLVALTDGSSLVANVALLENNGRVAGEVARALAFG